MILRVVRSTGPAVPRAETHLAAANSSWGAVRPYPTFLASRYPWREQRALGLMDEAWRSEKLECVRPDDVGAEGVSEFGDVPVEAGPTPDLLANRLQDRSGIAARCAQCRWCPRQCHLREVAGWPWS